MVKNYFYNLLLTLTNLLFPILSFPYVSRVLGPEGIGQVQFVFSFAQYFSIIASLGVPIYGLKEIAKHKGNVDGRSQVFSELMTIYSASCGCLFLLYLITINLFPYFAHDLRLYLAAGLMILLGFTNIEWLYSGMEEFRSIAVRSVAFKVLGLMLLYLFIRSRKDFDLYLYLLMFSYLGNNLLSLFLLKGKVSFRVVKAGLTRHLRPLGYILGTTLAASMYTDMDTVLLGFLSDKLTVGLYTAAVKLSKIAIPFVTSMNVILLPKIGKAFADGDDFEVRSILTKAFNFVVFFSIPVVCGLALLAPEFIRLFSGSEFLPATNSMRLLALLPLIIGFAHYFLFMILVPSDHNKEMFTCVMGGVITSVLLNFLLVPTYKEVGSAIANISAEVVVTALYFYFIKRFFVLGQRWMLVVEAVICCLVFIPVVWLIRVMDVPLILTVIFSVVSCAISYFLMQLLFRNPMVAETIAFIRSKINFAS